MRKTVVLMGISLALVTASCAGPEPLRSNGDLTVVNTGGVLPPPGRQDLVAADRPALIGPLDTISVNVFGIPDLEREMQVDASGRIAMPLAGTIDARGKTASELSTAIATALRANHVRNPQVTVNISSSVSQVVTIDGQVAEPGLYPVTNQMTLMRVIASAKGLTDLAKEDDVVILRTVGDHKMAGLYNITAIRRSAYDDPPVYANDVIIVGNSPQKQVFKNLLAVSPLIVGPLIAILN